jgi:hypothetical protein
LVNMGTGSGVANLIKFASAKVGNAVMTNAVAATNTQASDGAIRVLINATAYYIPLFNASHMTNPF